MKPRIRFCWECSRQLRGNHYAELVLEKYTMDKHPRILHKDCAKSMYPKEYENQLPRDYECAEDLEE